MEVIEKKIILKTTKTQGQRYQMQTLFQMTTTTHPRWLHSSPYMSPTGSLCPPPHQETKVYLGE